jgi:DNA-binding beta-propeller fold protein YncE
VTGADGVYEFTNLAPGSYTVAEVLPPGWQQTSPAAQNARIRRFSLAASDLAFDPVSGQIYASMPSSAGLLGNSVVAIDPATANIGRFEPVGSEPGKLAVSDDGRFLYAALQGAAAVRRVNLTTLTAGLQFALKRIFLGTVLRGP